MSVRLWRASRPHGRARWAASRVVLVILAGLVAIAGFILSRGPLPAQAYNLYGYYQPIFPTCRLVNNYSVPGNSTVNFTVNGNCGVPSSTLQVQAVVFEVTLWSGSSQGFLTIYPAGASRPNTATVNFAGNQGMSNLTEVTTGGNPGQVSVYNSASTSTSVYLDVKGYYDASNAGPYGLYNPVTPARILDTRFGTGTCSPSPCARLNQGAVTNVQVSGNSSLAEKPRLRPRLSICDWNG